MTRRLAAVLAILAAALPVGCTADGAGASPPLAWSDLPAGAAELALIVEDADSPTPAPLVHAIVLGLPPTETGLPEAALASPAGEGEGRAMGRNSYLSGQWLPPDPPPGHGPHRYVFQLFALSSPLGLEGTPGRGAVLRAMRGKVLATGHLVGTYGRS